MCILDAATAKQSIASVLKGQFDEIYEEAKEELSKETGQDFKDDTVRIQFGEGGEGVGTRKGSWLEASEGVQRNSACPYAVRLQMILIFNR